MVTDVYILTANNKLLVIKSTSEADEIPNV